MSFFANTTKRMDAPSVDILKKALEAGYGTDSATYVNGRALIPENCEMETLNAIAENKESCKLMNTLKKTTMKSTVHEVNVRDSEGDYKYSTVPEGGLSSVTNQHIRRQTYDAKYTQTLRGVTRQMELVDTFENAYASEKLAGVNTIIKALEYQMFQGDSSVVPTQFDGFVASILKAKKEEQNIVDLRGGTLKDKGEWAFNEIAEKVFQNGAYIDRALFPPVLSKDVKDIMWDKIRFILQDKANPLPPYPTAIGSVIKLQGEGAGADRYYHVKGKVEAEGDESLRPKKPKTVTPTAVEAADVTDSHFTVTAANGESYMYKVHAVNAYGVSEGTFSSGKVIVTDKGGVKLTIERESESTTGYIICRSKAGATGATATCMELCQIGANKDGDATTWIDTNSETPGTASMLFLCEQTQTQQAYTFAQLAPVSTYPLYPTNAAITPFLVIAYGTLEVRIPKFCGLIKGIDYGLKW